MVAGVRTRGLVIDWSGAGSRLLPALQAELPGHFELALARPDGRIEERVSGPVDLLLLCVRDPETPEVLGAVARAHRTRPQLIILVVARADPPEKLLRALHAGADDCLLESEASPDAVHRAIVCAIERRRASGTRGNEPAPPELLRFGDFELDLSTLELRQGGLSIELQPTPLRVLACLATRAGRTVSHQELLREVWKGLRVSDTAITSALKEVRHALGDDGSQQRWIRTLRGRGYRFVAPVDQRAPQPAATRRRPESVSREEPDSGDPAADFLGE